MAKPNALRAAEAAPVTGNLKRCSSCGAYKELSSFAKNRAQVDGYDGQCRTCVRIRKAEAYHRKKTIDNSQRRQIASNRVLDALDLKIIKVLCPLPTEDFDQLGTGVISFVTEAGVA